MLSLKQKIAQLQKLEAELLRLGADFDSREGGRTTSEHIELADEWGKVKDLRERLFLLDQSIDIDENSLKTAKQFNVDEQTQERLRQNIIRDTKRAESIIKSSTRTINAATSVFERLTTEFENQVSKNPEEKKVQKETTPKESKKAKVTEVKKPIAAAEVDKQQDQIEKKIRSSVDQINRRIPSIQKESLANIEEELRKLDLRVGGQIEPSVKNLSLIVKIKNRLLNSILTDDYKYEVKQFAKAFNEVTKMQSVLWRQIEETFKPPALLNAIKNITIDDTVTKLIDTGINTNIADPIANILRTDITTGGSYKALIEQLRTALITTTETPGLLDKYVKQITIDSLNQYNAQYTQVVSNDLGYEWFKYDNTDIETTRPFCDAMTDIKYFHVSEIPAILRAEGLTYVNKKGERVPVPIYSKTGLPNGMIPGTDASNFFVRRGGYNCGHQIRPVNAGTIPDDIKARVSATPAYIRWIAQQRVTV